MATFDQVKASVKALTQQQIAQTAIDANAKIMSTPPRPLGVVRHVDGVKDAPETSVKPGGVIVYDYNRLDEVALFALDTVRELSPVESGDYVRSHVIMLNGQPVDDMSGWKPGERITISNSEPYTRKIEIGKAGYRAHAHVYEKAAHTVAQRFGNIANISFVYEQAPPGAIHEWAKTTKEHRVGNPRSRAEWLTRQPTIVITEFS